MAVDPSLSQRLPALDLTSPSWPPGPLELAELPRPSEHAFLAGPASAPAREALEAAFEAPVKIGAFGEDLFESADLGAAPGDLLFVVSGLVRQVALVAAEQSDRARGRDPLVTDLFGPGCFVGLPELARSGPAHAAQATAWEEVIEAVRDTQQSHSQVSYRLATAEGTRFQYLSSPSLEAGEEPVPPLRVRRLPQARLRGLLAGDAGPQVRDLLQGWYDQLMAAGVRDRAALCEQISHNPLLSGLGRPALNALLHCVQRGLVSAGEDGREARYRDPSAPLHRQGTPCDGIFLVEGGEVELHVLPRGDGKEAAPAQVVAHEQAGELLCAGALGTPARHGAPPHPSTAWAIPGSAVCRWDRVQAQRIVQRSPAAWARIEELADTSRIRGHRGLARVTVVVEEEAGPLSGLLALGTAMALAHPEAEGPAEVGVVWLVDLAGGTDLLAALGDEALVPYELDCGDILDRVVDCQLLGGWRHPDLPRHLHREVRILSPKRGSEATLLVSQLRAVGGASDVVLHLPEHPGVAVELGPDGPPPIRLRNPNAAARFHRRALPPRWRGARLPARERWGADPGRLGTLAREGKAPAFAADYRSVFLESLRALPHAVVQLNADPDLWWRLTDEVPQRWIRVDHLDSAFVARLRHRATRFSSEQPDPHADATSDERRDRPGHLPSHNLRIPAAPRSLSRAARGELPKLLASGQTRPGRPGEDPLGVACWRAARMIRGCTVGLALSGGGTWGAAHIGVIRQLRAVGLPVDYVSGTSFGSLVGAIFAAGGHDAVEAFVGSADLDRGGRYLHAGYPEARRAWQDLLRDLWRARGNPVFRGLGATALADLRSLGRVVELAVDLRDLPPPPASSDPELRRLVEVARQQAVSLAELPLPFFPVASNLSTHTTHVSQWLELDLGVRIACSLPPIFPSMRLRGAPMVDGAALANVPAAEVRQRGADHVVAVNVVGAARVPRRELRTEYTAPRALGTETAEEAQEATMGGRVRSFLRDDLFGRMNQALVVGWLSIWKAGGDQARLHADELIDLKVRGVPLPATWRVRDVAAKTEELLARDPVSLGLRERWSRGRGAGQRTQERHLEVNPYEAPAAAAAPSP